MASIQPAGAVPNYYYKTPRRQNRSCDNCRRSKRACDAALASWEGCSNCARTGKTCNFENVQKHRSSRLNVAPFPNGQATATTRGVRVRPTDPERDRRSRAAPAQTSHLFKDVSTTSSYPLASYLDRIQSMNDFQHQTQENRREGGLSLHRQGIVSADSSRETSSDNYNLAAADRPGHRTEEFDERRSTENSDASPRRTSFMPTPRTVSSAHYLAEKANKALISTSLKHIYSDTLENALTCWVTARSCPYNNEGVFSHYENPPWMFSAPDNPSKLGMIRRIQRMDRATCVLNERPLTRRENQLASHALHATTMAFAAQWAQLSSASDPELAASQSRANRSKSVREVQTLIDASLFDFAEAKLASFDRSLQVTLWNEAHRALQKAIGIDSFQVAFAQVIFGFTQRPLSSEEFRRIKNNWESSAEYFDSSSALDSLSSSGMMWSDDEASPQSNFHRTPTVDRTGSRGSIESQELLDLEKDSLHLRDSLMRLSARRVRLSSPRTRQQRDHELAGLSPPDREDDNYLMDRMTFNQLFWLVMMCDTLSAAINNRLPIVSDQDSVVLLAIKGRQNQTSKPTLSPVHSEAGDSESLSYKSNDPCADSEEHPWGLYFLGRDIAARVTRSIHWPFSTDTAAVLLSEAAPVKALLYRRVKQIQNARFLRASCTQLEQSIFGALKVYEHWNKNFGGFISTCIEHHDELPLQIQSWYTVLVSHWNLACYLLTDLIEELDNLEESDQHHAAIRKSCGLLFHIRKQSAFEVADIGRIGRVRQDCTFRQTNEFHPSVNDGALLTEPWSEIMIRSFSRVSDQYLTWLSEIDQPRTDDLDMWQSLGDCSLLYQKLDCCVEALLDLGRKSDLAFLLAIHFKRRLVLLKGD